MSFTIQEIESQPDVWRSVMRKFNSEKQGIAQAFDGMHFSRVIVTGCGSTYYLAQSAAQLLSIYTDYEAHALPASQVWLLPESFPVQNTLVLAISRSGTTTETIRAVERYRADGGENVAVITCYPESPLAKLAGVVLSAEAAHEESVVQTRSFTSMYLLSVGLAYLLGEQPELLAEMEQLPGELEALAAKYGGWPEIWADPGRFQKIFFLGNGPNYGLACEAMLKVKEMSLSWVEAYHTLEFRHGPMSLVDDQTLVVGLLSERARPAEMAVLRDLQKLGAAVVVCDGDRGGDIAWVPEYHAQTSAEINAWLRGLLYLPLMQRLGYYRALRKNLNPDLPTHLQAVIYL